jgi:fructuronate reductase
MALTTGSVLRRATLATVPTASRPLIPPGELEAGIVHFGLGAFHRAHQAVYTEEAIAAAGGEWGIVAVAPRRRTLVDTLTAQDHLFSVTSLGSDDGQTRVVGALAGVRHAPADPYAVVALLADPAIRVVTLTVTEKAYLLDPASGRLRVDTALRRELGGQDPPESVPALLVAGLRARARADAGPIALVSCDNLPANGRLLHDAVTQAVTLIGADADQVAAWVHESVSFPGTMVDRVVPATTERTLATAQAALGVADLAAVAAEPYRQWVIEDAFPGGRPAWEAAGAVLTTDAGPYERLKLRTLNGVHSALAYLGALAGCDTIAAALKLPGLRAALERFVVEDIAPSLDPPDGVSVVEYGQSVLDRFANEAIAHRTLQVAMDGTQKLPQRILHTMAARRAAGAWPRWAALAVAGWMRFVAGQADDGRPLPLDDPLADLVRKALAEAGPTPAAQVESLLRLDQVFTPQLAADEVVRGLITEWVEALARYGVVKTLAGTGERA